MEVGGSGKALPKERITGDGTHRVTVIYVVEVICGKYSILRTRLGDEIEVLCFPGSSDGICS